jgi:hypothetical protein
MSLHTPGDGFYAGPGSPPASRWSVSLHQIKPALATTEAAMTMFSEKMPLIKSTDAIQEKTRVRMTEIPNSILKIQPVQYAERPVHDQAV